jgi:triosephosphate isomerase
MFKTVDETVSFIEAIKEDVKDTDVEVVLCVPYTALDAAVKAAKGTKVLIGAQNMYPEDSGAFTGEISPVMLKSIGVTYVIVGHSERRQIFKESDALINKKVLKALASDLKPILCVGETLEEREAGTTKEIVKVQTVAGLQGVGRAELAKVVVAYEPVWAIGTGKTASSADANEVISYIRELIAELYDDEISEEVRIQYGGSVKPDNVEDIMAQSDIDGALVGGASLKPESYLELVNF